MTTYQSQCLIDSGHPSLSGHFPGNPVVPGVLILDEVLHALRRWQSQCRVAGFNTVKFLQPLLPEEAFMVEFQQTRSDRVKFECRKNKLVFANGVIDLDEA